MSHRIYLRSWKPVLFDRWKEVNYDNTTKNHKSFLLSSIYADNLYYKINYLTLIRLFFVVVTGSSTFKWISGVKLFSKRPKCLRSAADLANKCQQEFYSLLDGIRIFSLAFFPMVRDLLEWFSKIFGFKTKNNQLQKIFE